MADVTNGAIGQEALDVSEYRAGSCNIGPEEIARRRTSGHVGTVVSVGLLGVLLATGAPRWSRLFVALPASVAAGGYLQARAQFCAGFGSRGEYNFGPVGSSEQVTDPDDRARDMRTARRIQGQSLAAGLAAAAVAVALPRV